MTICYNKLWKLLIDKNMKKKDLRLATGMSTTALAKLGKNQHVSTEISDENLYRTGLRFLRYHRARKGGKP